MIALPTWSLTITWINCKWRQMPSYRLLERAGRHGDSHTIIFHFEAFHFFYYFSQSAKSSAHLITMQAVLLTSGILTQFSICFYYRLLPIIVADVKNHSIFLWLIPITAKPCTQTVSHPSLLTSYNGLRNYSQSQRQRKRVNPWSILLRANAVVILATITLSCQHDKRHTLMPLIQPVELFFCTYSMQCFRTH